MLSVRSVVLRVFALLVALLPLATVVGAPVGRAESLFASQPPPSASDAPVAASEVPLHVWPAAERRGPFLLGAVEAFRAPRRADEMRVRWQRVLFDWSVIQRGGPTDWAPGWVDEKMLDVERVAGRPVVGLLIGTPAWAAGGRGVNAPPQGLDLPPDDPRNLWAAWVRTVVGRYAGRVDAWVIWNEPDVWSDTTGDRQWSGTVPEYYRLLKVAYLAAKEADPETQILMAGMTYWWDEEYGREQYFQRVLREAAADRTAPANGWYFDGAVAQLYNDPRALFDVPTRFRAMMRQYGIDKPIWVNETNVVPWDDPWSSLPRAEFRATLDEQASYLVQATAYALAAGVERMAVYKMLDDDDLDQKPVRRAYGLVRGDAGSTPRLIARTFRVVSEELGPTSRAQLVEDGPIRLVYLEQPSRARRLTVVWSMAPYPIEVELRALGTQAQVMTKFGDIAPMPVTADGLTRVPALGATANTLPGRPDTFYIGGEPVMVLEPLPDRYQPLAPIGPTTPITPSPTRDDSQPLRDDPQPARHDPLPARQDADAREMVTP